MKKNKRGGKSSRSNGDERNKRKKGQVMGMPFQFIFALILIAVALFVGFWVIKNFLETAEQAKINLFVNDLRNEIIKKWNKEASETITLDLSKKIDYVCFTNLSRCNSPSGIPDLTNFCQEARLYGEKNNLFFWPLGEAEKYHVKSYWHIHCGTRENPKECLNIEKTRCIPVVKGQVKIKLTNPGTHYISIEAGG